MSGGDLEIDWVRTTRIGGENFQAVDVPLAEEHERYRLEIRQGGTPLRSIEIDGSAYDYTSAMQSADGALGRWRSALPVFPRPMDLDLRG